MEKQTIQSLLSKLYEDSSFAHDDFPFVVDGTIIKFVEASPIPREDCWLVVSATSDGENTFWKIPGYCYGEEELEPGVAFQVTRGEEEEVDVFVEADEKLEDSLLYPVIGYFWIKFGSLAQAVDAYNSKKVFKFLDFSVKVVDVQEVGYDEGSDGDAVIQVKKDGIETFISIGATYDSTEGFSWNQYRICKCSKEQKTIHEWNPV